LAVVGCVVGVCVFLWAPQGLVGFVGLLSVVDVASAPCFVAVGVAVGWQEWVSWMVEGVLFNSVLSVGVVGRHVWVTSVVVGVLVNCGLGWVAVGWQ